jgi:outer membrane receptor protein involved in Fe transport
MKWINTCFIRQSPLLAVLIGLVGSTLLFTVSPVAAQPLSLRQSVEGPQKRDDTATLSGAVIDESGAVVPGASVTAVNLTTGQPRETQSSQEGRFTFSTLAPGRYSITARLFGFDSTEVHEVVLASGREVSITLEIKVASLNEAVSVKGTAAPVAAGSSTIDVTPLEVRNVAGAAENIFRVLQTLPGVSAVNDFDSRLTVRGGGPDQNLTMMDGVEIHNPFRLFGLTSAFNPATVDRFELTAGGFSAKYGDRLSSILVVENRRHRGPNARIRE